MKDKAPSFENPPVVEVALAVQFETRSDLTVPRLGRLWEVYRDRFPIVEEKPRVPQKVEAFGEQPKEAPHEKIVVALGNVQLDGPPSPRLWFKSSDGIQLLQLQSDRIVHNWRSHVVDTSAKPEYPRYEWIRNAFATELREFRDFLASEEMDDIRPNQCEVTYVNHILPEKGAWTRHSDLAAILSVWSGAFSDEFLPEPEDIRLGMRFVIPSEKDGRPLGRLYAVLDPARLVSNGEPLYNLTMTARLAPDGHGEGGALDALDLAHRWVVNGFRSITTDQMHQVWREV